MDIKCRVVGCCVCADIRAGIPARRHRLSIARAAEHIGVIYSILARHINPQLLKQSLDWHGAIESYAIELRRYADFEAKWLLEGEQPVPQPRRPKRRTSSDCS